MILDNWDEALATAPMKAQLLLFLFLDSLMNLEEMTKTFKGQSKAIVVILKGIDMAVEIGDV